MDWHGRGHGRGLEGRGDRGRGTRPAAKANTSVITENTTQTMSVEMTAEDWEKWSQFKGLSLGDKPTVEAPTSAALANFGGNNSRTMKYKSINAPWLLDSGASRHMAGSYKIFIDYNPELKKQDVKLADGSSQPIMGGGTIMCNTDMYLSSVLHVPSFPINLLSISCITKELNCVAIFFPSWCLFQELGTGRRLGTGSMRDGLYFLYDNLSPTVGAATFHSPLEEFLHHRRLGHISFVTLSQLYPDLYNKVNKGSLVCDACLYGKQTRSSYTSFPTTIWVDH